MERKNKIEQLKHDSILSCLEFLNFEDLLTFAICNKNCYKYVYKLIHQRKNPGLTKYIEQCLFHKFLHKLINKIRPFYNEIYAGTNHTTLNNFIWRYFVNLEEIMPFILFLDDPMIDFKRDSVKCSKPHYEDLEDDFITYKELYKKRPNDFFDLMDTILCRFIPEWNIFKSKWYFSPPMLKFTRLFVTDICTVCLYEKPDVSAHCFVCIATHCRNPWKKFNTCTTCAESIRKHRYDRVKRATVKAVETRDKIWDCPLMNQACECYSHAGQGCQCPCHRNSDLDSDIMESLSSDDETYLPSEFEMSDEEESNTIENHACVTPLF